MLSLIIIVVFVLFKCARVYRKKCLSRILGVILAFCIGLEAMLLGGFLAFKVSNENNTKQYETIEFLLFFF